jgi:hypothetical protein
MVVKNSYRQRTATTINCELSILDDFRALAKHERKTLSEKFEELMVSELERQKIIVN